MTLDSKCYYIVTIVSPPIHWFLSVNRCVFCAERGTNWYYRLVIIVVPLLCMLKQCFFSADNVSEYLSHSVLCRIHQLFVCLCRFLQINLLPTFFHKQQLQQQQQQHQQHQQQQQQWYQHQHQHLYQHQHHHQHVFFILWGLTPCKWAAQRRLCIANTFADLCHTDCTVQCWLPSHKWAAQCRACIINMFADFHHISDSVQCQLSVLPQTLSLHSVHLKPSQFFRLALHICTAVSV